MNSESPQPQFDLRAGLQYRKKSLEARLREKNEELKMLCMQEATLTGVLPPETPLEVEQSCYRQWQDEPLYTYPESLINKHFSKDELSKRISELEYKLQTGVAAMTVDLDRDPMRYGISLTTSRKKPKPSRTDLQL